jgi:hypothetical protein
MLTLALVMERSAICDLSSLSRAGNSLRRLLLQGWS